MEDKLKNLNNHELKLKAAGVNFSIFIASDLVTKHIQEYVDEFSNLEQEDINKIFFTTSYVLLFHAQKILWERGPVENEKSALLFEEYLFQMFEKTIGANPKLHVKDLVEYVIAGDSSREVQYIGSKLCKDFNKDDLFLMLKINTIFYTFLEKGGFFESVKRSWELPNEKLEEILKRIESEDEIENSSI